MMQNMYFITLESTIVTTMQILETKKKQLADLASKARSSKTRKRPLPKSEDSLPQNVSWHLVTTKCIAKIWLSHVSNCICGETFARIYVIYVLLLATALKKA